MKNVTILSLFFLVFMVGVAGGWIVSSLSGLHYYKSKLDIAITNSNGDEMFRIPAGTIFSSKHKTTPAGEEGYWAGIPLYFGLASEADDILELIPSPDNEFEYIYYNALSVEDLKSQ